jgi:hypothetical protein
MNKTLLALFAVLLVLSLAACDFFLLPPDAGDGGSRYPDANDGMVCLTIGAGGGGTSRALTTPLAIDGVNYYEVVFKGPNGTLYQVEFAKEDGEEARKITIPTDTYSGAARAVMFAGHKDGSNYTLLAIGVINSTVTGGSTVSNSVIAWNTTQVTFLLSALLNDVNATPNDPDSSTFKIIGTTLYNGTDYATATTLRTPAIDKTTADPYFPVFPIPGVGYTCDEDYTYDNNNPTYLEEHIVGRYTITNPHFAGVVAGETAWTVNSAGYTLLPQTAATGVEIYPAAFSPGDPIDGEFNFVVELRGDATDGLWRVSIDVPVRALGLFAPSSTTGSTREWHIIGGTNNNDPDGGKDVDSLGGAIILGVGY